jgi:hypothetical protein
LILVSKYLMLSVIRYQVEKLRAEGLGARAEDEDKSVSAQN